MSESRENQIMAWRWMKIEKPTETRLSRQHVKALQKVIAALERIREREGSLDPFWASAYERAIHELKEDEEKEKAA
jgi:hypothetical protein